MYTKIVVPAGLMLGVLVSDLTQVTPSQWLVLLAAIIAGVCSITSAIVLRQNKMLQEIHIMVNSNLSRALAANATAVAALAALNIYHAELTKIAADQSAALAAAVAVKDHPPLQAEP